jgi:hypothetical protein
MPDWGEPGGFFRDRSPVSTIITAQRATKSGSRSKGQLERHI